jgi:hypothetical protein
MRCATFKKSGLVPIALSIALSINLFVSESSASATPTKTSAASSPTLSQRDAIPRIETALNTGDIQQADSLHALIASQRRSGSPHRRVIVDARLAASRGNWKTTEAILHSWRDDPARREASGEIFFWLGWAALHQARLSEADSFLVLASAYSDESRAQEALEYRFAALLDNSPALQAYLRGLPESPLPRPLRIASLRQVPESSRIHSHARWQLVQLLEAEGDSIAAGGVLDTLARNSATIPGRRAILDQALKKADTSPDSARAIYESLLIKYQQGVSAEIARKRLKN